MAARIADHLGYRVIAVDLVPERLARAEQRGIHTIDLRRARRSSLGDAIRDLTDGRGTDSVIDAVGMEAHGSPVATVGADRPPALLPDAIGKRLMQTAGVDRLSALYSAIDIVRRGGTISLIGVYGGMADPLPMLTLFDKQVTLADGTGQRQAVGGRHHAAADRRRPARRRHVRHARAAARRSSARLRHLPEEAGRRGEGHAEAVIDWWPPVLRGFSWSCAGYQSESHSSVRRNGSADVRGGAPINAFCLYRLIDLLPRGRYCCALLRCRPRTFTCVTCRTLTERTM